jgi:hypothetical protein
VKHIFDYSPAFTVENIKYKLAALCSIPVEQQVLSFQHQPLEDGHTLQDYKVSQSSELSLAKRSSKQCKYFYVRSKTDQFSYEYKPELTFAVIKRYIETDYFIPVEVMTFRSGERMLEDQCSLKDYNIQRGGTIFLEVEAREFHISITPPKGEEFQITCTYLTTVSEAKQQIETLLQLPKDMQQLLCDTHILENAQSFATAKIKVGTLLTLKYKPMQVTVKLENDQALPVACAYDTLVSELKERIAQGGNCPVDLQRLTYAEEELKDDRTVGDYGIKANSMLRLYQGYEDRKEVLVRSIVGGTALLEYDPKALVGAIKEAAVRKLGVELGQKEVKFAGSVLEEDSTLAAGNVQRGSTLYITSKSAS